MSDPGSKSANPANSPITYRDAGVDIDAGNALVDAIKPLAKSTRRPGADADLGGFGGLFDLARAGFKDPVLVAANDGVGTKLRIAIDTGRHDTIGIDLVAMCVNDLIVQGAEPLFFLDYFSCGKLNVTTGTAIVSGIAEGCRQAGCALIGGETAEMPGMYATDDYDLAGFSVGAVERGSVLPRADVEAGDVLLGLESSGPHSNGYSLIRRLVAEENLSWDAPAPFAPDLELGAALITPTRIYVKPILNAIRETGAIKAPGAASAIKAPRVAGAIKAPRGAGAIKAMAHITGGGLQENIPRVLPDGIAAQIDLTSWRAPAVFDWLQRSGRLETPDLLRTFNCGIGMIVVVAKDMADQVTASLARDGETVVTIGALCDRGAGDAVVFSGDLEFAV